MQKFGPKNVRKEDIKFFRTTQGAYLFGLIAHAMTIPMFWWLKVPELILFNAFVSVPAFLTAIILNRRGRHNLGFSFAFFELLVHQILATYLLGWEFGAQFWLIYLAGLCFFNPKWKRSVQFPLLLLISSTYVLLHQLAYNGIYTFDPQLTEYVFLINAISALAALAVLINYFSREAQRAERQLTEEKEVTERQNTQLLRQHETLAIEQEKTSKLLRKIESLFGQQVSKEVAETLIQSETEIDSKFYNATIMFLDIRDFTVFADHREPEEVAKFQNIVFSELIDIVREHKGIVLQILGDGIMAVFGTPVVNKDHAANAVDAGYAMVQKVEELGDSGRIPSIRVGIGLNTGKVIAGNVGNETRKFYSLTGKNVIIAARIEQLNKQFKSQFLISESVHDAIGENAIDTHSLGQIELKGIERKVGVYQLA